MKKLILSLIIFSSLFGFTSCGNTSSKINGRVISTEVVDTIKGGNKIGGHMSFFTTENKFINKVTIKDSNNSIKSFNIISENKSFSNDLVGDSVMIRETINGNFQLIKIINI